MKMRRFAQTVATDPTLDGALADPQQIIADLRRQLSASHAERDAAPARECRGAGGHQFLARRLGAGVRRKLEKAVRLCEAAFGTLSEVDDDQSCGIAWHKAPPAFVETMRRPRTIVPGNAHYRLLQGEMSSTSKM
jgi:hypothetical protein